MAAYFRTVRNFPISVHLYNWTSFNLGFAFFGLYTVLYNLFLLRVGFNQELIGQVNGVGQLSWALLALPASLASRRFGLRNVLVVGSLLVSLGLGVLPLVERVPLQVRIAWLFASTFILWTGAALVSVNNLPLLTYITHPEERSHALAVSGSSIALASVVGSLVAGLLPGWIASLGGTTLEQAAPYGLALWLAPVFFLINAFLFARISTNGPLVSEPETKKAAPPPIVLFLFIGIVIFLQTASEGGVRAFFNIYLDKDLGVSTAQIGALFGAAGVLPILSALLMPLLVGRFGSGAAFCLAGLGGAVFLILLGAVPHPLAAALGFIGFNMIANLAASVRSLLSQEIVEPRWRSVSSAILILGLALGWASMAFLGSLLIGQAGFSGLMYVSAASGLLSITLMFAYLRLNPTHQVATPLVHEA